MSQIGHTIIMKTMPLFKQKFIELLEEVENSGKAASAERIDRFYADIIGRKDGKEQWM